MKSWYVDNVTWPRGKGARRWWPSAVTVAGLLSGLVAPHLPATLALLALANALIADGLDGWLARKLDAVSEFGRWLDWVSDLVLTVYFLMILIPRDVVGVFGFGLMAVWWAYATTFKVRFSGRLLVTVAMAMRVVGVVGWV